MFFQTKGYEDMELSTQILIKEAINHNLEVEILDRMENFILIKNKDKSEYIKQATKTSLDTYISLLIMESKQVTKKVLMKHGINTPMGKEYTSIDEAKNDYELYLNKGVVVKPNSTNFGIGIKMIKNLDNRVIYDEALEEAFKNDKQVLVEELISGKEYRFLVMGDEVVAVLNRVPANVIGDGIKTVRELITEKNKNPLRGVGYKSPLEKIRTGPDEAHYLSMQNKSFDYIPGNDEYVQLRENSNISTGGDSHDLTDDMPEYYKKIAIKATKSVGANICGVDLIVNDMELSSYNSNYSIIELNFNPAIHIHTYPLLGKNRKPALKLLELLSLI